MDKKYECEYCGYKSTESEWLSASEHHTVSSFSEMVLATDQVICPDCEGQLMLEDLLCKPHMCPDCGTVSDASEWTETSMRRGNEEADAGEEIPITWSFSTADMGDTVYCPHCEIDLERSEIDTSDSAGTCNPELPCDAECDSWGTCKRNRRSKHK